jgi:hypothetical protein
LARWDRPELDRTWSREPNAATGFGRVVPVEPSAAEFDGEAGGAFRSVQGDAGWCLVPLGEQAAGDDLHSGRRREVEEGRIGLCGQAGELGPQDGMSLVGADLAQADPQHAVDAHLDLVRNHGSPGQRA